MTTTQATLGERRLKDLTDAEFEALYDCDRFTATVLGSKFRYIIKHMCTRLMTNAFSVILRDWYDFAATLSGPPKLGYPMAAISDSLVIFAGPMSEAVRNSVDEFGPENLGPGDILMSNDPYRRRHPPERHPVRAADLPRRRDRRDPQHPAAHDGHRRHRPRRVQRRQGQHLRERADDPADARLPRRQAGEVDLQPPLRQRPLRRGDAARHALDRGRPAARRAPPARGDRALRPARRTSAPCATPPTSVPSRCARRSSPRPTACTRART